MVALISKSKALHAWDYLAYALDSMYIDMDARGAFALVKSQSGPVSYKVYFCEDGKEIPHATDCSCYDHRVNCNVCKHMEIVDVFYQMIYGVHRAPAIVESPEKDVESMSQECQENVEDVSAAQHLIDERVDQYERALRYPAVSLKDLQVDARKAGLRVKMLKGQGYKEAYIQALVKRFRMTLEMQAETAALEALPELPLLSPEVAPVSPQVALDEVDLLLDSGERAAVYLATDKPVIYGSFELPKAKKFSTEQQRREAPLNGDRAFNLMR